MLYLNKDLFFTLNAAGLQ